MGAVWDGGDVAFDPETWAAVYRVLKPGAHLLVCGGTRTYHRMAVAVEDAGFEIRDCIGWCYAQGLPKSLDVAGAIDRSSGASPAEWAVWLRRRRGELGLSREDLAEQVACTPASVRDWEEGRARKKGGPVEHLLPAPSYRKRLTAILGYPESEGAVFAHQAARDWDGWGTALKPAWEMILVARKPLVGTVAENVLAYGTGGLNVGGCRIGVDEVPINTFDDGAKPFGGGAGHPYTQRPSKGRWPANVVLSHAPECTVVGESRWACVSECPVRLLDDQAGVRTSGKVSGNGFAGETPTAVYGKFSDKSLHADVVYGDSGAASRFFTVFDFGGADPIRFCAKAPRKERPVGADGTKHPTIKPLSLMRWLVELVTPPGATVLDPFMGSGSLAEAASIEGRRWTGVEQCDGTDGRPDYVELIAQRMDRFAAKAAS
jgi:site-specific DNA-methyltransferase (adenine-specific)